jgi:anaphase-promoting complex subunit 3
VNLPQDQRCNGCLEIKAKCCSTLGRHRQAREALEDILKNAAAEGPSRASFILYM